MNLKKYTIHMIGNAHIDPVWLWKWPEGYSEVLATCCSAVDRMKETPAFVFTRGAAATYQWIEETDPELFREIKKYVVSGNWNIVNGWWEQPDVNIPCGEALVRQCLYGKRYFRDKFGVDVITGYNVDTFGHSSVLPQILKKAGFRYYVFMRPEPHEKNLPLPVFWWQSPDGSRVLALRLRDFGVGYNNNVDENSVGIVTGNIPRGFRDAVHFYGVGDHGGGPTRENIAEIIKLDARPDMPHLKFSTLGKFFRALNRSRLAFPVVKDELQMHACGCYTAMSQIKKHNRRAENMLLTAEKFSSIAGAFFGRKYPKKLLDSAWETLLFVHFHDVIAGSATLEAYEDIFQFFGEIESIAYKTQVSCLQRIIREINIPGNGCTMVVFNSLPWQRKDTVECDVGTFHGTNFVLVDDQENEIPYQISHPVSLTQTVRSRLVFTADVPATGYRVYTYRYGVQPKLKTDNCLKVSENCLENDFFKIDIDKTGRLKSVLDKKDNRQILAAPGNSLVVLNDQSDTWSHGVESFRDEIGYFGQDGQVKAEIMETGPLRAVLRIKNRYGNSGAATDVIIYKDRPFIEFRLTVDWHEHLRMLKISFPLNLVNPKATFEVPYGSFVRQTDGKEVPAQKWMDLSGSSYGVSLLNDCKYGFDVMGADMRMSVLRSPAYAWDNSHFKSLDKLKSVQYHDQGQQELVYRLYPHKGRWTEAATAHMAYELNNPLIPIPGYAHKGKLPCHCSFVAAGPLNVILEVIKRAEDSNDLVLRAYETAGKKSRAELCFEHIGKKYHFNINPYEIKTLQVSFKPKFRVRNAPLLA